MKHGAVVPVWRVSLVWRIREKCGMGGILRRRRGRVKDVGQYDKAEKVEIEAGLRGG